MSQPDEVIAVDIDGTICTIDPDYSKCELVPGAIDALTAMRAKGYKVFLHTGRHILNYDVTTTWLREHKVPYDHLVFGKPVAKYYIDDRAIEFKSWKDALGKMDL